MWLRIKGGVCLVCATLRWSWRGRRSPWGRSPPGWAAWSAAGRSAPWCWSRESDHWSLRLTEEEEGESVVVFNYTCLVLVTPTGYGRTDRLFSSTVHSSLFRNANVRCVSQVVIECVDHETVSVSDLCLNKTIYDLNSYSYVRGKGLYWKRSCDQFRLKRRFVKRDTSEVFCKKKKKIDKFIMKYNESSS